ncbi:MAG: DUF3467 domain-containing protein, partial [Candidatus Dormibacteria bacterium]
MAHENEIREGNPIATEGVPVLYANVASCTVSFNDMRVYFAEAMPKEVVTQKKDNTIKLSEALVAPRLCVVCAPEFARSLRDALSNSISQYEQLFGPLRALPQEQDLQR